jgi:hypothetical protein
MLAAPERRLPDPRIPHDVQQFLAEHVDSAEQLDALMLLRADPARAWTCEALSQALFSVPQSTARTLERLAAHGFAAVDGGAYRYAAPPGDEPRLAALAEAYRADRAGVIKHLFAGRRDPVRTLADAFRLRKD